MPGKIMNRSCFKICFFESALDQCFQTHIILQTGKLAFLPGSQGMEKEREEQNYKHCLWRKKVLACLSVALWLGNTVLHLTMPMVSWLCKSRSPISRVSVSFACPLGHGEICFQVFSCTYPKCLSMTWCLGLWESPYFLLLGWWLLIPL